MSQIYLILNHLRLTVNLLRRCCGVNWHRKNTYTSGRKLKQKAFSTIVYLHDILQNSITESSFAHKQTIKNSQCCRKWWSYRTFNLAVIQHINFFDSHVSCPFSGCLDDWNCYTSETFDWLRSDLITASFKKISLHIIEKLCVYSIFSYLSNITFTFGFLGKTQHGTLVFPFTKHVWCCIAVQQ